MIDDLPHATTKAAIDVALSAWENDPANQSRLVEVNDADATHLFGFAGEHVIAKRFSMVLVPASADLAAEVGTAGRGSTLHQLLGALTADAVEQTRTQWEEANKERITELNQ